MKQKKKQSVVFASGAFEYKQKQQLIKAGNFLRIFLRGCAVLEVVLADLQH